MPTKKRKVHAKQSMQQRNGRGFKVGDWVMLNSGGPFMLVIGRMFSDIHCAWPDDTGVVHLKSFPSVCLY